MHWTQLLSDRRLGADRAERPQSRGWARSDFERDYDRLVFSPAFRRLQNKTQVFPLPGNIFVHNRLTHSLEVSCLGRSLGNIVGEVLSERYPTDRETPFRSGISAIVSAACLAHDMGNPPFGHSGERAISAYFGEGPGKRWEPLVRAEGGRWEDFLYFEGNANAFRLLTHQFRGRRPGGFALTYSTVASIVKYPYSSLLAGGKSKFGFFATEEETMKEVATELGLERRTASALSYARHPLVYLVEAADDICYQIMDIEDAAKLHILSREEAQGLLSAFFSEEELRAAYLRADVFCQPGTAELQSLVTLEALSASTPVVLADALALPHLVDEGVNGHLFPPGDHVALADRIARILDLSDADRAAMGEASHAKALHHSAQKTVDIFERLYRGATAAEVRAML